MALTLTSATTSDSSDRIVEERWAELISPVPGLIQNSIAFFLSPVERTIPYPSPFVVRSPALSAGLKTPVRFPGWKPPPRSWKAWTDRMESLHGATWKQAGIRTAILNSCSTIHRHDDLILSLAEKWFPSTNTFAFKWGEATVTLEDVAVIGSYSVTGEPVFITAQSPEQIEVVRELDSERKKLHEGSHKVLQTQWLKRFMDSGSPIEHEAYLAMWLSRFVFPTKSQSDTVSRQVLDIAVILARGIKIALAPAVLASVYASLREIKSYLLARDYGSVLPVSAPLQLLQIWIWERFVALRPDPVIQEIGAEQPWFARWDGLMYKGNSGNASDISYEMFVWRPYYGICKSRGYYSERAQVITTSCDMDERAETLIKILRHSELVGLDQSCIMQYLPHRVARQLGYDQDVPAPVARFDFSHIIAWDSYTRRGREERVYVPPGTYLAGLTTKYTGWWDGNYKISYSETPSTIIETLKDLHVYPPPPGFRAFRKCDLPSPQDG